MSYLFIYVVVSGRVRWMLFNIGVGKIGGCVLMWFGIKFIVGNVVVYGEYEVGGHCFILIWLKSVMDS